MNSLHIKFVNRAVGTRRPGGNLIFVHGAVGDSRTWEAQVELFSRQYRVITYSRRWHYPNPAELNGMRYTAAVHLEDLLELMEDCGSAHLVGHSYGAALCAAAAGQRPDLVKSLVLAEPSLFSLLASNPSGAAVLTQAAAAITKIVPLLHRGQSELALREFLNVILGPGGFDRLLGRARAVMLDNLHTLGPTIEGMEADEPFTVEQIARIAAPTMLLEGEQTPALFRLTVDELERGLPHAKRVSLPGVSHGLQLENPQAFNQAVLAFLEEPEMAALPH